MITIAIAKSQPIYYKFELDTNSDSW